MIDLSMQVKQSEFGDLVGISQPAVSDLLARSVLSPDASAKQWLREYCGHLRERAAGRAAMGDLSLATERSALARVQRQRIEMELDEKRGALVSADLIEPRLKAAVIAAREMLRNEPPRLAREIFGKTRSEIEAALCEAFDGFLERLSRLPAAVRDDAISGSEFCDD